MKNAYSKKIVHPQETLMVWEMPSHDCRLSHEQVVTEENLGNNKRR